MSVHAVFMHSVPVRMWMQRMREKPFLYAASFPFLVEASGFLSSPFEKQSDDAAKIQLCHFLSL